jgi:NADPH:quinone reductase-like Zn-dependent oxidoreductase
MVLPVPDGVPWDQAGGFPEAFCTANDALFTQAHLVAGERVLISGGAGGVGTAAVQLAHATGAQVVASVRTLENHPKVLSLGADEVVEPDRAPDHGPYDVSLELVGAPGVAAVLPAMAVGGRVVVIGVGAGSKLEIDLLAMMGRRATISASTLRARSTQEKAAVATAAGKRALSLLGHGSIGVPVAEQLPMVRASEAYERFAAGGKFGKIVLVN